MKWISVKEQMPEDYDRVLIYKTDVAIMCFGVAFYADKRFRFDSTCLPNSHAKEKIMDATISGVTHWMPIEPPKE